MYLNIICLSNITYHVSVIHSLSNFSYAFVCCQFSLATVNSSAGNRDKCASHPLLSLHPWDVLSEWEGWVLW